MDHNARTSPDDEERAAARREEARVDAGLVERARGDDPDAFGLLYERWFDRVHDLAFRITRDPSLAAETAQDVFVAAWRSLATLDSPGAFGGWLLRITRNTALNRRRKELRTSPRDAEGMAVIEQVGGRADAPAGFGVEDRAASAADPARAAEDSEVVALVWESAEALGARDAEVLDLTLRHGLTPAEIGDVIGINRNAANQTVHRVRRRLKSAVQARVLWRGGSPVCGDLADALTAESVTSFNADAVRIATTHAEGCGQCARRRSMKLEPSAIFAAAPFLVAPMLKQKIAHALAAQDVPVTNSPSFAANGEAQAGAGAAPGARAGGRRPRALVAVAVLVVTIGAVVVVGAEELDDGRLATRRAAERQPASAVPPTVQTTLPLVVLPPTSRPASSLEPPPPPPLATSPAPEPSPPVTASFSIAPASSSVLTFVRPTLSWTTAHAASVEVSGPGFTSSSPSGTAAVCPGAPAGALCTAPSGTYTYVLRARDGSGAVVVERMASFAVA